MENAPLPLLISNNYCIIIINLINVNVNMYKVIIYIIPLFAVCLLFSGCASPFGRQANNIGADQKVQIPQGETVIKYQDQISIKDGKFIPENIKVKKGTKITWHNQDESEHQIRSADILELQSGSLAPDAYFEFPFMQPGIYKYNCALHPEMSGTVEVAN